MDERERRCRKRGRGRFGWRGREGQAEAETREGEAERKRRTHGWSGVPGVELRFSSDEEGMLTARAAKGGVGTSGSGGAALSSGEREQLKWQLFYDQSSELLGGREAQPPVRAARLDRAGPRGAGGAGGRGVRDHTRGECSLGVPRVSAPVPRATSVERDARLIQTRNP